MADQDGSPSEMITQLLRHMTSSPNNAAVKGDICWTYCVPSESPYHSFYLHRVTEGGIPPTVVEDQEKPGLNRINGPTWINNK